jgi:hypothetical protein
VALSVRRGNEIDSYVSWNYRENHWNIGRIGGAVGRTCGTGKGTFANPLMVGGDGRIYEHETGLNYDGEAPFVETGPIEIGQGQRVMQALQLIPDERTQGDVTATLKARTYPERAGDHGRALYAEEPHARYGSADARSACASPARGWRTGASAGCGWSCGGGESDEAAYAASGSGGVGGRGPRPCPPSRVA